MTNNFTLEMEPTDPLKLLLNAIFLYCFSTIRLPLLIYPDCYKHTLFTLLRLPKYFITA